jgi:hypothetical protein
LPTRYLKPGIRDSETIDALSPRAETFFYRLLVTVDDFGRADARPSMLKAACFPIKASVSAKDCAEMLEELARAGLVDKYMHDGKPYLQMRKWDNQPRAKESKFPPLDAACIQVYADARTPRTLLPETETETGTGTGTGTDLSSPAATHPAVPGRAPKSSKPKTTMYAAALVALGVDPQHAADWLTVRKSKDSPLTQTALDGVIAEAAKAGITLPEAIRRAAEAGWAGFRAIWAWPPGAGQGQAAERDAEAKEAAREAERLEMLAAMSRPGAPAPPGAREALRAFAKGFGRGGAPPDADGPPAQAP